MDPHRDIDAGDPAADTADLTDADAFGRWYDEHWHRAVAYAIRLTGDAALAEDLAADALARAWQRWHIIGTPERPWAYVATSIHNLAVSHFRRADRQRGHLAHLDSPVTPSPEAGVVDRQMVRGVLRLLPDSERAAVALHYLDDLAGPDVARRLSVRPATVRSQLHRARRRVSALGAA